MGKTSEEQFKGDYYDEQYFADTKGKEFTLSDGSKEHWGYKNPTGIYLGAKDITKAWKTMFDPVKLLDIGAGRGQFIADARAQGMNAVGFDFSEWAVGDEGRYSKCDKDWLIVHDATEEWPYHDNSFDLCVALDFFEHIHEEDLDFVINELYRVSSKWIFLLIATVDGVRETGYMLKKGESVNWDDKRTWAGHVTVQTEEWWTNRLERDNTFLRKDLFHYFYSLLEKNLVTNWMQNSVLVYDIMED